MVFPRTVLFLLPSPPNRLQTGTDQPRISKEDPTVLFSHSLPPHKQAGTEVVPRTPGQELDCERLHPALGNLFVPHLRLGRATWRGKPRLRAEGGHNLLEPGAQPPRVLRNPPPKARPLHPRPSRQIPGGARRGGDSPAARPAPQGSQSGFCLRQPGAQRSGRGPGLGRGLGQEGREVQ